MCTETRALWTGVKTIQDMPGQSRGVQQPCLLHTMLGSSFGPSTWLFPQCFIWIELKAFRSWIPSAKHSVQSSLKKKKRPWTQQVISSKTGFVFLSENHMCSLGPCFSTVNPRTWDPQMLQIYHNRNVCQKLCIPIFTKLYHINDLFPCYCPSCCLYSSITCFTMSDSHITHFKKQYQIMDINYFCVSICLFVCFRQDLYIPVWPSLELPM